MTESEQTGQVAAAAPPFGGRRNELLVLLGIGLLAFVLRLLFVLGMQDSPYFDAPIMDEEYHVQWAEAIAAGEEFQPGPFFRAPLYPWFLGALRSAFGADLLLPRIVQCLLGALCAILCYLLGKRAFDPRTGLLAGFGGATYWVFLYFDSQLLVPTLILPLDLLALLLTIGLARRPDGRSAFLAGLVWGLSAIARPNVLLLMPLLAIWLLLRARPRWRAGLLRATWLTIGVLLPIAPITIYNATEGDDLVLIASNGGVNFWIGNNPVADGRTAVVPGTRYGWWEGYHDSIAQAEAAEGRKLKPSEVSQHYAAKTWDWILDNPGDALANLGWKFRLFFSDLELGNNLEVRFFSERYNPFIRFLPLRFCVLMGLGLLGLLLCLRRPGELFPLWSFVLVYILSIVAFFVCSRYRLPVLPPLIVLGAHAFFWLIDAARQRRFAALLAGLLTAVLIGFGTTRAPLTLGDDNGYLQLGNAAALAGRPAEAIGHFEEALRINPANFVVAVGLAKSLHFSGERRRALTVLQAAQQRRPFVPEIIDSLLNVQIESGMFNEAEALADAAFQHDPSMPLLRYHRGRIRFARGDLDGAIEEFRAETRRDPMSFNTWFSLARMYEARNDPGKNDPDNTIDAYLRALERRAGADPNFVGPAFQTAIRLLRSAGRGAEASRLEQEFRAWMQTGP